MEKERENAKMKEREREEMQSKREKRKKRERDEKERGKDAEQSKKGKHYGRRGESVGQHAVQVESSARNHRLDGWGAGRVIDGRRNCQREYGRSKIGGRKG